MGHLTAHIEIRSAWFFANTLCEEGNYRAVQPPSITRLVPVMREAAGEARNRIAPAISSIRPSRPRGIRLITQFRNSGSARNDRVIGVSRKVGAIAFTRMLDGASSTAIALVSPSSACFVMQ